MIKIQLNILVMIFLGITFILIKIKWIYSTATDLFFWKILLLIIIVKFSSKNIYKWHQQQVNNIVFVFV